MGDFGQSKTEYERIINDDRYLGYIQWKDNVPTGTSITKEEALDKYHIKIINKKYSQPLNNYFK